MECHTEFMNKQMHSSEQSTTSTDNTEDILILVANESHYAEAKYQHHHHHHRFVDQAAVDTSFTVLSAPPLAANDSMGDIDLSRMQMTRDHLERISSDEIDESTEVLLVIRSEEKTPHTKSGGVSGTDSDVEVLMSEEIVDSDWSAGAGDELEQKEEDNCEAIEDFVDNANVRSIKTNRSESISGNSLKQVAAGSSCTDHDVLSGEEFSSAASLMGAYDKLTHSELVTILCDQAVRIEQLETQLSRYRSVQQTFFDNIAELKLQLDDVTKEYSRTN